MKELDIKKIWEKANERETPEKKYSLAEIQLLHKKKSRQVSKSSRLGILFDIILKCAVMIELFYLLIILNYQYPYQIVIGILLAATCVFVIFEIGFIKRLNLIQETDSVIVNLQKKLDFIKTTYRKFIFIGGLSSPLFVVSGFFLFYYFKYGEIKMGFPLEDPVLYIILLTAYLLPILGQWPIYKMQLKELNESIENIEDIQTAGIKYEEARKRKIKTVIVSSILILIGLVIFLIILLR
jgi:hypothetical protein